MIPFITYLLESGICLTLFYFVYKITLSKESFFRLNRVVILASIILSLILPIWTITIIKEIPSSQYISIDTQGDISFINNLFPLEANTFNWLEIIPILLICIYLLGVLFFIVKQIVGHLQILFFLKQSNKIGSNIFLVDKKISPFSWFNKIIVNRQDYKTNGEIIVEHENAHISAKHFYDLLFINLFVAFQWFNPISWLLKNELIGNHEFQADEKVLNKGINAKKYQLLLITKVVAYNTHIPVVSHLYSGSLTKRIKMMLKKKSKLSKSIKGLLVIPLIFSAILVFAETKYISESEPISQQEQPEKEVATTVKIEISIKNNGDIFIDNELCALDNVTNRFDEIITKVKQPKSIHMMLMIESNVSMGIIADIKNAMRNINERENITYTYKADNKAYKADTTIYKADTTGIMLTFHEKKANKEQGKVEFKKIPPRPVLVAENLINIDINAKGLFLITYPPQEKIVVKSLEELDSHIKKAVENINKYGSGEVSSSITSDRATTNVAFLEVIELLNANSIKNIYEIEEERR